MRERWDAAGLHVYGYKEKKAADDPDRPAIRSRLVLAAARELKKAGEVENFTFSGGIPPRWEEKVPMGTVAATEFVRKTYIDPKHVFVNPSAPATTNQELKFLRKKADEHDWSQVVSIGWGLHERTIKTLDDKIFSAKNFLWFKKDKINIDFKSAEEILQTYPSPRNQQRYQRVIDVLHNSEGEQRFIKYESRKMNWFKLNFPFGAEILDVFARFHRPKAD